MADIIIVSVAVVVFVAVFLLFFLLYASLMRRIARRKHRRVSTLVGVGFCAFIGISVGGLLPSLEVPAVWEAGFGRDCWHPGNAAIGRRTQCLRRRYRGATAPPIFRRAEESRYVSPTRCCCLDGHDSGADYCISNTSRFRSGAQNYWP